MHRASKWDLVRGCRLPALFKPKKRWRLASQVDPLDCLEHAPDKQGIWRRNYSTLHAFEEQFLEVMYDQASRWQIIVLSEKEAKDRYPNLVIASLVELTARKSQVAKFLRGSYSTEHTDFVSTPDQDSGTKRGRRLPQISNAR